MHSFVDAAIVQVIPKGQRKLGRQIQLRRIIKCSGQFGRCRSIQDRAAQCHQTRTQAGKHRANAVTRCTGFIVVQQSVIGIGIARDCACFFFAQIHDFLQDWQK